MTSPTPPPAPLIDRIGALPDEQAITTLATESDTVLTVTLVIGPGERVKCSGL